MDLRLLIESESDSISHSVLSDSLWPHGLQPTRLLSPWNSPGKKTGVGCHFLLQEIFLIQESNPGLLRCRQIFFFPTELREKPMFGASITILGLDSWGLAECLCVTVYLCNLRPCLMLPGQPGLASGGCEGAGLSCLFQRTLTVRDGDRAPLPFSGATYLRSRLWRAARAGLRMDRGSCAWHSAGLRGSEATTGHRKSKGYHSQKDPAGPGFISELGN